jgi:DNA-binding transcriptional LysR family regulator
MASVDPRKLQTFRVVVETGKISTAAKLLHLSQPAVSSQIQALEQECGRTLLLRTPRGVEPTRWGLRMLEAARQVRTALADAEAALEEEPALGGELVLAASMTTGAHVLPPLLAAFRAVHGPVPFRLDIGNTAQVTEWLVAGRVPLAMVEGHSRSTRMRLERYLPDELVAVASASATHLHSIGRALDLAEVPLLLREPGSGSRVIVEEALARVLGPRRVLRHLLQLGSNQAVKMAAVAGLGVAFLSRWSVRQEVAVGRLRILPLHDLRIDRAFSWAMTTPRVHGVAGRFLEFARRTPPALP